MSTTPVKRKMADRWTEKLAAKGFTPIASYFLDNYHRLNVTTPEAMLIIHLMSYKWDEKNPRPGFTKLAAKMGVTPTAVRNHARSLEKRKKLLERIMRVGRPNAFNLTPLFNALEKLMDADAMKKPKNTTPKEPDADEQEPETDSALERQRASARPPRAKLIGT